MVSWNFRPASNTGSYEDLELSPLKATETTALQKPKLQRLVRQASVMDTQKDRDGAMKLTYWF